MNKVQHDSTTTKNGPAAEAAANKTQDAQAKVCTGCFLTMLINDCEAEAGGHSSSSSGSKEDEIIFAAHV